MGFLPDDAKNKLLTPALTLGVRLKGFLKIILLMCCLFFFVSVPLFIDVDAQHESVTRATPLSFCCRWRSPM